MTMSGSEPGLMNSGGTGGMHKSGVNSPPAVQNINLYSADGTPVYNKPVPGNSLPYQQSSGAGVSGTNGDGGGEGSAGGGAVSSQGINMNMGEPQKRKRGRPRKYGPDGAMGLNLVAPSAANPAPALVSAAVSVASPAAFSPAAPQSAPATIAVPPASTGAGSPSPAPAAKKSRGRPPGSTNKNKNQHPQQQRQPPQQVETQGQLGIGFTPHVITVQSGEDVSSKIMSFSHHGPRAICILSANGAISNVTLRQAATSGGTVTYEGRFEILSLCGSYMLSDFGGQRSRTGGLSVSLAGPDGRVLGGSVAGLLTAASPVQVVVASFLAEGPRDARQSQMETFTMSGKVTPGSGPTGANSPPSRGTLSESSGGGGSPLNHSTGTCNNSGQQVMHTVPWK